MNDSTFSSEDKPTQLLLSILCNIIIPALILSKYSTNDHLGPVYGLLIAISFPLVFGLYELIKNKKKNLISILGIVSVLLTGGLALMQINIIWFAIKEAAIPLILFLATISSLIVKRSFLKNFILNPKFFNVDLINQSIESRQSRDYSNKLFNRATLLIAFSFLLSATLNFTLAITLLKSPPNTPAFNNELGKMTALSFPIIMIPVMSFMIFTFWYLMRGLKKATGLSLEEIIKSQK